MKKMSLADCFAAALAKRGKEETQPLRNDVPSKPDQRSEAIERLNPLEFSLSLSLFHVIGQTVPALPNHTRMAIDRRVC